MKPGATQRIALLLNANKHRDREIMGGVGRFLQSTRASWELCIEDDYRCRLDGAARWPVDGFIADFDDPAVRQSLAGARQPVVAVGGSYQDARRYPTGVPYIATDNRALVNIALNHLIEAGAERFAMFSIPQRPDTRWARERELAFVGLEARAGADAEIYRGEAADCAAWDGAMASLQEWLAGLVKPVGIIAVNDARARLLLQACVRSGLAVPEQVAIIGIDDDPLAQLFGRISLSSVRSGANDMGETAARTLHRMLGGVPETGTQLVAPCGINAQASTSLACAGHPLVMRARYFIRQFGCQRIRVEHVAEFVGVSRSSLEHCFKSSTGHSVHDEILRWKLDAAKAMLSETDANLGDVAQRCGFTTVQYMYAVFRRELGCTPRAFADGAQARDGLSFQRGQAGERHAGLALPL